MPLLSQQYLNTRESMFTYVVSASFAPGRQAHACLPGGHRLWRRHCHHRVRPGWTDPGPVSLTAGPAAVRMSRAPQRARGESGLVWSRRRAERRSVGSVQLAEPFAERLELGQERGSWWPWVCTTRTAESGWQDCRAEVSVKRATQRCLSQGTRGASAGLGSARDHWDLAMAAGPVFCFWAVICVAHGELAASWVSHLQSLTTMGRAEMRTWSQEMVRG